MSDDSPASEPGVERAALLEVGAAGADLRYWRAREAMRHAELRLGVQASATQALEGRATSMLGWSVTGGLALGAAVVNGSHVKAATVAATCLILAAMLCIVAISTRQWSGPGYQPREVLEDPMPTELEAIESMVDGYQRAVSENSLGFNRFKTMLNCALVLIVAAPVSGAATLAMFPEAGPRIVP